MKRHLWLPLLLAPVLFGETLSICASFRDEQERFPRVRMARRQNGSRIGALFAAAGISYPPRQIFIRVFKYEAEVELWSLSPAAGCFQKMKTYSICASSGRLGPKRRQGDGQVPEGFYFIDRFNPWSQFHLSLGINYPNASDRQLAESRDPGGDIFIHGNCVTIGCIPIRDDPIEELYLIAVDTRSGGQRQIPMHIFPCRMDDNEKMLRNLAGGNAERWRFWENIKQGYDYFETHFRLPTITVDRRGRYVIDRGSNSPGGGGETGGNS